MKKVLSLVLCFALVFLLGACKKKNEKELTLDEQIKQAYLIKTKEEAPLEEMSIRYIHTFENAYAVFVDCSLWAAGDAITNVQVGEYLFVFSTTQEMLIYKDGSCYSLTEAYDQKLLSDEQWKTLYNTWAGTNPHLYADDGVFNRNDLLAIMEEAKELLPIGEYTLESPSNWVKYFFRCNRKILVNCFEEKENAIVISYSEEKADRKTVLQYGIFLHLICSRYPDAICDADYTYTFETNRSYFGLLFLFPNYKDAGYETPLAACMDIDMTGKVQQNAFYIGMSDFFEVLEGHFSRGGTVYKYQFDGYEKYLDNIG